MSAVALQKHVRPDEWHNYFAAPDGTYLRSVVRSDGRAVISVMGHASPRRGESIAESAERAHLISTVRPRSAGGRTVRLADIYSGCGGLSLGVWEACRALGLRPSAAAAFDNAQGALDIYKKNFAPDRTYADDVRRLIDGDLGERTTSSERRIRREVGVVDLLVAGPPCQGFSPLNYARHLPDCRNGLYTKVARLAALVEPSHVLIENINAISSRTRRVVSRTVEELQRLQYETHELVVPLVTIGVPQLRRRHIIVATSKKGLDAHEVLKQFKGGPRDLSWAIRDLARPTSQSAFDVPSVPSRKNARRMRYLKANGLYHLPNWLRPACHRGDHTYKSMYGRLRWDEPAQTITSGYGSMGQGRYVHPSGTRTLTPHEAARLQFFPDWFDFGRRSRTEYADVIGNAVPMKLSYVFALALLR